MRIYDPRVGRFLSIDPLSNEYAELTPYQYASNRPVDGIDQDGLEYSPAGRINGIARDATSVKLYPLHPVVMQQTNAKIQQEQMQRQLPILAPDMYGNGHIGPRWLVEANVASIRQKYVNAVGDNIAGGPLGATGYLIAGDKGSFAGAAGDQIMYSFGGLDQKGYLATLKTPTLEKDIPYTEQPWEIVNNDPKVRKLPNPYSRFTRFETKYSEHAKTFGTVGNLTRTAYYNRAVALADAAIGGDILGFTSEGNTTFKLNQKTGEFIVINPDGKISSFYRRVNDPVKYLETQKQKYGVKKDQ